MNNNSLNLIAAILLSIGIIFGWQYFYEKPRLAKLANEQKTYSKQIEDAKKQSAPETTIISRDESLKNNGERLKIKSDLLSGSISLKGLRFDDLTLLQYRQKADDTSPFVELFSPGSAKNGYFAEVGWISNNFPDLVPNSNSTWQADSDEILPGKPVTLTWKNQGIEFKVIITMDKNYLFTLKQSVINNSNQPLSLQNYGLINQNYNATEKLVNILHQGPISVTNGQLNEYNYDDIKDKKNQKFNSSALEWLGITDKYWLSAIIPDKSTTYSSNFNYAIKSGMEKFQVDFISPVQIIEPNTTYSVTHHLFAGAKKVDLLDSYESSLDIKLFDRAIDFGWFYLLTKPLFNALNFFYKYVGNFGISILIVTVIIKLLMFSLANKSYRSMKKMKKVQPEIERIKKLYGEDKARLNQEIMELYKKEKINPVSGCLPLLVQIPVFFSIYKVLYVTIEMRHAPFYGWIHDLSAPDPTSLFNFFGLLPFSPPGFLSIGAWPIIMAATMFLQQKMSPEPADPVQAQVMKFMPLIFLVMFSSFPVGLLIYWSWNNVLSIIQQYYTNKLDKNDR
jgi:YidC/Oxa1 family membrane protein insertase